MDVLTKEQRHRAMSNIHSQNTSIELRLRKVLWHRGYRYRVNYKKLPGKPDIVLTKYKIAVFCDSDFFHGKDWFNVLKPRLRRGDNSEFWEKKIVRNMERDEYNNKVLLEMGWTVIRFWGSEIENDVEKCVAVIEETILEKKLSGVYDLCDNIDL